MRAAHPDFVFWAEAYWDLEPRLVEQGFDACYDKRLYDRLVHGEPASSIRAHLGADPGVPGPHRALRREPRRAAAGVASLAGAGGRAAAVVALTLPGVALLHEGQDDGRRVRVPVTLGRRPDEEPDADLRGVVRAAAGGARRRDAARRRGRWSTVEGWPDNRSCEHLVAWTWTGRDAGTSSSSTCPTSGPTGGSGWTACARRRSC